MSVFILNAPILTDWGRFDFHKIELAEVKKILTDGRFISAIEHEETATLMSQLTGIEIPVNRVAIKMQPGDKAIVFVFRVLTKHSEGKILNQDELAQVRCLFDEGKIRCFILSQDELTQVYFEFGLLTRLE